MYDFIVNWFKSDEVKQIACKKCGVINIYTERTENLNTCLNCLYPNYINVEDRIEYLIDGDFVTYDDELKSTDILNFKDVKKYKNRIKENEKKNKKNSAVTTGYGTIDGVIVNLAIMDFKFMGGSLGRVEGQKIYNCVKKAIKYKTPLIIVSSSGGARMQEGVFSLMQMARTSSVLTELSEIGLPYISLLTNPTMGGVSASFAFLGDIIISEPEAIIGFAGKRVIEQTINEKLPEGFQTAEYLLKKGLIDDIVPRQKQKIYISNVIHLFNNNCATEDKKNIETVHVIDSKTELPEKVKKAVEKEDIESIIQNSALTKQGEYNE